jgi:hypothetical protein
LALLVDVVSEFKSFSDALKDLNGGVVPAGVTVLLRLCNPPRRGRGKPTEPRLLYPLVSIPYCDTIS